jgi:fumarate reductase subunit C
MKPTDFSQTPLVRRYGVRGAKLYARIWFPFLYVLLVAISAGLWANYSDSLSAEFLILIVMLTLLAASLLTRMWINYVSAIERIESRSGMESTDHG